MYALPPFSQNSANQEGYASFYTFSRHLRKAQAFEGMNLKLPFPQILCMSQIPLSELSTRVLSSSDLLFQPLQDLIQRLSQQVQALSSIKQVKTLKKIEHAYRAFIEEVCQTSGEKRVQLLDINLPLIHQLVQQNQLPSMQALVELNVAIHTSDTHGLTALHLAAREGYGEMVSLLLQAGADTKAQDLEGRISLHHAILKGQLDTTRQLAVQEADSFALTHKEESVLHLAASCGHLEILSYLLTQPCQNLLEFGDLNGETPLHHAVCGEPKEQIVQLLLDQGASVNARNNFGYTPLHWAAKHGHLASAKLLVSKGADSLLANTNGDMPMDLALHCEQDQLVRYLIDPMRFKEEPTTIPADQDPEGFYYQRFEEAYHQGEGFEQLFYLQKLGALYLKKSQFIVSAHLLNNTLALATRLFFPETYLDYLLKKLENIEDRYLQELCGLRSPDKHQSDLKVYRQNLQEIRSQAQEQLKADISPKQVQKELTKKLKQILVRLIEDTFYFIQEKPPTSFAIIGLGSMSRGEMAPYSDLELAILIEESTPKSQEYFRRFSQLLELKVINLGESKYDLVRPRRVKQHLIPAQSFTPHGFSLDSGGLSPLGKSGVYELIGTPQEITHFQTVEWLTRHEGEIILANALTTCCRIKGDKRLIEAYRKHISTILNTRPKWFKREKMREKRALELLKGHLEEFKPFLEEDRLNLRAFDVKKDFYRPIQMVIGAMSLYYGLRSRNTLDIIQELAQNQVIGTEIAQTLQKTLSHILSLRMHAHLFYQNGKEILYYPKKAHDSEATGLYRIKEEEAKVVLEIYRVLMPLQKLAYSFAQGNQQAFSKASCYDASIGKTTLDAEVLLNYDAAEKSYIQSTALNPNDPDALNNLQRIKLVLGQVQETLKYNLDRLAILKNKLSNQPHPDIANSLNNLGTAYQDLGEIPKAIFYYEQSLAMSKQLYGDKPHLNIVDTLCSLGRAYRGLGEVQTAIAYHEQSLVMGKQLFGDKPHTYIANSLDNLGAAYNDLGEIQKAIAYHEQSVVIKKQIYGVKPCPDLANSLNNLGNAHLNLRRFRLALFYYKESLAINKGIYGDKPHPAIAIALSNLGVIYRNLGEVQMAITYHEQSLAMKKQLYGDKPHPDIADTLCNIGCAYTDLKQTSKATAYLEQSLTVMKKLYGDKPHPAIADTLCNIGCAYYASSELQKALAYLEQSLAIARQLYGNTPHPAITDTLGNLITVCYDSGETQKAIFYYQQSLAMNSQSHPDMPNT